MRRRDFIVLAGGAAIGSPLRLHAQQPRKSARIGLLDARPNIPLFAAANSGFSDQLRQLGWIEGQNLTIEYRYPLIQALILRPRLPNWSGQISMHSSPSVLSSYCKPLLARPTQSR